MGILSSKIGSWESCIIIIIILYIIIVILKIIAGKEMEQDI
jgi:cyanate permease